MRTTYDAIDRFAAIGTAGDSAGGLIGPTALGQPETRPLATGLARVSGRAYRRPMDELLDWVRRHPWLAVLVALVIGLAVTAYRSGDPDGCAVAFAGRPDC